MADFRAGKGRTVPAHIPRMARRPRVRLLEVTVTAEKPNLWKWHVFERDVEVMHGHETSRGMHRSDSGIRRTPSAPRSAVVQRLLQLHAHSLVIEQGCAGPSRRRAGPEYCLPPDPRRSPSSICPDLICDKDNSLVDEYQLVGIETRRKFTPGRGRRRRRACPARLRARFF